MEKAYDTLYDELLSQLKPLVLKLPVREERQRIASWIKKLNEPNAKDPLWKKSRNLYARLMKTMLEKGVVDEPFRGNPPSDPLAPLPTYMTIFLEGSNYDSASDKQSSVEDSSRRNSGKRKLTYTPKKTASLPDLSVMTSEEESDEDLNSLLRGPTHRPPTPTSFSIPKMFTSTPGPMKTGSSSTVQIPVKQPSAATSHTIPNYKGIVEKEVQMKERLLSNRYSEERLKLQRHHDELLQKILDKKTKEVEEFRSEYRNKVLQLENNNKTLERRLQQAQEENVRLREVKERQAYDFRNAQNQTTSNLRTECEKRLSKLKEEQEEATLRLQGEHQGHLQKLIDETTNSMSRMEEEYKSQADNMSLVIKECEEKCTKLRENLEESETGRRKEQERGHEMEIEVSQNKELLLQSEDRVRELSEEIKKSEKEYTESVEEQQNSAHTASELARQEYTHSLNKLQEKKSTLEGELKESKDTNEELQRTLDNRVWELETEHKSAVTKLERLCEKKLRGAEKSADKKLMESHNEVTELKRELRRKDKEVRELYEAQKLQNQQSERALNDLKKEMQNNTDRLYKEVQQQVFALEEDLEKAAYEREKLDVEYNKRINEEKLRCDETVAELQMKTEREKQELIEKYHSEIGELQKVQDEDRKRLEEEKISELEEMDRKNKNRFADEIEKSDELRSKIDSLNTEVEESRKSHKRTVSEAAAMREKERKQNQIDGEKLAVSHRAELEEINKKHARELEKLTHKTNYRIKMIEEEFDHRFQQNSQGLEKAQSTADLAQEETKRQAVMYERSIKKLYQEIELAKVDEEQRQRGIVKALEQEVETQRSMIRHQDKRCKMLELEMEEKITRTKLIYEEKMRGVMPLSVREELEETIAALKAQSTILEQKAGILQSELDSRTKRNTPNRTPNKASARGSPFLKAR